MFRRFSVSVALVGLSSGHHSNKTRPLWASSPLSSTGIQGCRGIAVSTSPILLRSRTACGLIRPRLEVGEDRAGLICGGICKNCGHPVDAHRDKFCAVDHMGIASVEESIQGLIDVGKLKPKNEWDLDIKCFLPQDVEPERDEVVGAVPYIASDREEACSLLLSRFDDAWTEMLDHEPWMWKHDSQRLPLVANVGHSGSGKTTCLYLSCRAFTEKYPGSRAVYISFDDGTETAADLNENPARIGQRILHSLCSQWRARSVNLFDFPNCSTIDAIEYARKALMLGPGQHVLLAVDDLQKTEFPNANLTLLMAVMTEYFIRASQLPRHERFTAFLVASSSRAVDVFHMLEKQPPKPIALQPLPQLEYNETKSQILLRKLCEQDSHRNLWVPGASSALSLSTEGPDQVVAIRRQVLGAMWDVGMHPGLLNTVFEQFSVQPQTLILEDFVAWRTNAVAKAFHQSDSKTWSERYAIYGKGKEKLLLTHLFLPRQYPHSGLPMIDLENEYETKWRSQARILHDAQTNGLISVSREVSGDQLVFYTTSAPMASILVQEAANGDSSDDPFIKEFAVLVNELHRWDAHGDEGKRFKKIMFQTLLSTLLATDDDIPLSALFADLPCKYESMEIDHRKFHHEFSHSSPKSKTYPFGSTEALGVCGVIPPSNLCQFNEGIDFALHLPLVGGGSLEVFVHCDDRFDGNAGNAEDIISEFRACQKRLKKLKPGGLHVLVSINELPRGWTRSDPERQYDEGFLDCRQLIHEVCPFAFEAYTTGATFKRYCNLEEVLTEGSKRGPAT